MSCVNWLDKYGNIVVVTLLVLGGNELVSFLKVLYISSLYSLGSIVGRDAGAFQAAYSS